MNKKILAIIFLGLIIIGGVFWLFINKHNNKITREHKHGIVQEPNNVQDNQFIDNNQEKVTDNNGNINNNKTQEKDVNNQPNDTDNVQRDNSLEEIEKDIDELSKTLDELESVVE